MLREYVMKRGCTIHPSVTRFVILGVTSCGRPEIAPQEDIDLGGAWLPRAGGCSQLIHAGEPVYIATELGDVRSMSVIPNGQKFEILSLRSRVMNATLSKALVGLVPAGILFVGSVLLFLRERTLGSFLQPIGVGCLVVVVLTHLCEALHLFPLDALGAGAQRRSLPRPLDCCSRPHLISRRIFASRADQATPVTAAEPEPA
jgi:hypothetical protein